MSTTLQRIADWYSSNGGGDWEHGAGIKIATLDNPGWRVTINLEGTPLQETLFLSHEDQYEHSSLWLRCWVDDRRFHAACGPTRLEDALTVFLAWAKA
jgi:hypothetical protein